MIQITFFDTTVSDATSTATVSDTTSTAIYLQEDNLFKERRFHAQRSAMKFMMHSKHVNND